MNTTEMKRYQSAEWHFALDIPRRWNSFPPVSGNSPHEVIRFASKEDGTHLVIIFRTTRDPKTPLKEVCNQVQKILTKQGFANFATTETAIGSRAALVLDFDRPDRTLKKAGFLKSTIGFLRKTARFFAQKWLFQQPAKGEGTWSCREYFLAEGTLQYTLGFGTTNKDGMFELFDRMAKSFEFSAE